MGVEDGVGVRSGCWSRRTTRGNGRAGLDLSASARPCCSPFYETPATHACSSICYYSLCHPFLLCPPSPPPASTICTAHNAPRIIETAGARTRSRPSRRSPTTPRRARRAFHSPPSSQPGPRFSPAPPSHTNASRLQQPHVRYLNRVHDPRLAPFRDVGRHIIHATDKQTFCHSVGLAAIPASPGAAGYVRSRCACGYQTTNSSPALAGSRRLPPPPRHPHVPPLARSARPPRISYSPTCDRPGCLGPEHTAITAS